MNFKKILFIGLVGGALSPLAALANGLVITNNTDAPSTSVINHAACSTVLGASGITQPHSVNTVGSTTIGFACALHPHSCEADIYMTNDCKGTVIATAVFDTATGVKSVTAKDYSKYTLSAPVGSFSITLDPKKVS